MQKLYLYLLAENYLIVIMFCNKIRRQNMSVLLVNRCGQRKITLLTTRVIQAFFKVKFLLCFIMFDL